MILQSSIVNSSNVFFLDFKYLSTLVNFLLYKMYVLYCPQPILISLPLYSPNILLDFLGLLTISLKTIGKNEL